MRISLYNNKYLVGFMLLVFVVPAYFVRVPIVLTIYRYLGFACLFILLLFVIKGRKVSPPFLWIYGFYGFMFLTTLINKGNLWLFVCDSYASFGLCILFALMLEKKPSVLLSTTKVLDILVYINLIVMLIFPKGLYIITKEPHWLLGHKNILSRIMLSIVCLALIRAYYFFGKLKISTIILIVCSVLTLILAKSATALIGFSIFALFLFLFHNKERGLPKIFSLLTGMIISVAAFFAILIFNFQQYFSFVIENILGKDLTLTKRLAVWQMSLDKIFHKPIIGYGYLTGSEYVEMFERDTYTHPHNYYLFILMTGGIVLAAILLLGYLYANKVLNSSMSTIFSKTIMFTLIAFLIMGLTESLVSTVLMYPILILAMNADKLKGRQLPGNRWVAPIQADKL